MKAMILAAGLGTRLRPLTDSLPKALVKVAGRTMLELVLCRLRNCGVGEVVINVHYFADMIVDYLKANDNFGMSIKISREENLLDTGGGLKRAEHLLLAERKSREQPFILHNVDVMSTIDLRGMVQFHIKNGALATLAVQHRKTSRYLLFDERQHLCARPPDDLDTQAAGLTSASHPRAFSGIHVISPRMLGMMEEGTYSIITSYLRMAGEGENILAFDADDAYWRDLGTPESLVQATQDLSQSAGLQEAVRA